MSEYKFNLKLRGKNVRYRKWKVKDKKKFISSLNNSKNENSAKDAKDALVYDCLENKRLVLSEEEYKYVLVKIRSETLGTKYQYVLNCDQCNQNFDHFVNIDAIYEQKYSKYSEISAGTHSIKMTDLKSKEFYDQSMNSAINEEERYLIDFILHIQSYNDNDGLSFNDINNIISEIDIGEFEEIIRKWDKMKFRINTVHEVQCKNCSDKALYEFDVLPGFFPESWGI